MQLSPVWSAVGATLGGHPDRLSIVLQKLSKVLPLLFIFVVFPGPAVDALVILLIAGITVSAAISLYYKEPLALRFFALVPHLCFWMQMSLTVIVMKELFLQAIHGTPAEAGLLIEAIGHLMIGGSTKLALVILVLLWLLQRKTDTLALFLNQAGRCFHLEMYYGECYSLEARLESKEITPEQWHGEREALDSRLRTQTRVGEFGERLQRYTRALDLLTVMSILTGFVFSLCDKGPHCWLDFYALAVGGVAVLSFMSFAWSFLLGMCLKESRVYYIHEYCQESFPGRREMLLALGGMSIETVALAGFGLPPGLSFAFKVLVNGRYRPSRPAEVEVAPPKLTPEPAKLAPHQITWQYRFLLGEEVVGEWEIAGDRWLALGPVSSLNNLAGPLTSEPLYKLPARWVEAPAPESECAFFSPRQVMASHLLEVFRAYASTLLTRDTVLQLLYGWEKVFPDCSYPKGEELSRFTRVLAHLLQDQVSLRAMGSILEAYRELSGNLSDDRALAEEIRIALSAEIVPQYCSESGVLHVLVPDESVVRVLRNGIKNFELENLRRALRFRFRTLMGGGMRPVILTERDVRRSFREIARQLNPHVVVLCWDEICPGASVNILSEIDI